MKRALWNEMWSKLSVLNIPQKFDGSSNRIINFHSIGECRPKPVSKHHLETIIQFVNGKYNIVGLSEIVKESNDKKVALTFDDGCENFLTNAVPLLEKYDIPATVFVIADAICNSNFEKPAGLECELLNRYQLQYLDNHELITIGNHSKTHADLSNINGDDLYEEIYKSKSILNKYVDDIEYFSYPYGNYNKECIQMVKDTHTMAFATGLNTVGSTGKYEIPRFNGSRNKSQVSWCLSDMVGETYYLYNIFK